jgi:hypothetical protein
MKKLLFLLSAVTAITFAPQASQALSSDDFQFENDTISSVLHLYVSPHGLRNWGSDVLGLSTLSSYDRTLIYWAAEPAYDIYDIRVDFSGAHYDFTEGYNLATISKVWVTCTKPGVVTLNCR